MIAPMPTRAILLDALGTLVALESPAPALAALLRERHGLEVDPADAGRALRAEMGYYRQQCIRASDAAALAELRLECAALVARELALELPPGELVPTLLASLRFAAFPDAPDALARWRAAGLRLVVASNWDVSLHDVLAATGLAPLLDGVVTSAEAGASKPAPALFAAALAVAGTAASDALHVGDSLAEDVEGARAAGIDAVWLQRAPDGAPAPAGVTVIASLDELAVAA
jgi:putative hydrolase of the HAD superfamily